MNRRQPDPMARIFLLLLVIPVIWAAILAAPLLGEGLPGLLKGLAEIDPSRLTWTADTPRIILLFLLAYGLGLLIYAASRKTTGGWRNTAPPAGAIPGPCAATMRIVRSQCTTSCLPGMSV